MSILRRDDDVDDERNEYGYPKQQARYRDPFAISIAVFGVLVQAGGFLWFGGQVVQRVTHNEKSTEVLQAEVVMLKQVVAKQDSQIAVLSSQWVNIQATLQRIENKLEQK